MTFLILAAGGAVVQAEVPLGDPTRPPTAFAGPVSAASAEAGLRLQSVLLPKGGRPTAVISGQVVRVGETIGDARLVRLSETEAVLQGPQGVERLELTPDVKKTMGTHKAAKPAGEKRERP